MKPVIPVLMYHAVDDAHVPGADPHYCVTRPRFAQHLRVFNRCGRPGASVRDLLSGVAAPHAVGITFDDGHLSNLHAAETLAAVGMSADFFINPSVVGTTCFLGWDALRDMQQMGMSIQSHGMTHRYLNDLPVAEVRTELAVSKAEIEDRLGVAVTLFAPPGGRKPAGFAELAGETGYRAVCTSDVGLWRPTLVASMSMPARFADLPSGSIVDSPAQLVPRLAVLAATSPDRIERWTRGARTEIWLMQSRGQMLGAAKRVVGNQRYERLRERFVGSAQRAVAGD